MHNQNSKITLRSKCPINYSLELLGDPWSLLILRDIVYFNKHSFGEFLASEEAIARNILTVRLRKLCTSGIIEKCVHPTDRRKEQYFLTANGLTLLPLLFDLAEWGSLHIGASRDASLWISAAQSNRQKALQVATEVISKGGSIYVGSPNALQVLRN